jgi:hypothetical protein
LPLEHSNSAQYVSHYNTATNAGFLREKNEPALLTKAVKLFLSVYLCVLVLRALELDNKQGRNAGCIFGHVTREEGGRVIQIGGTMNPPTRALFIISLRSTPQAAF